MAPFFTLLDPDNSGRMFEDKLENIKVNGTILSEKRAATKSQCALYCVQDNRCTQFSYHGDVVGNNCCLGSATSGQENQDDWITYLILKYSNVKIFETFEFVGFKINKILDNFDTCNYYTIIFGLIFTNSLALKILMLLILYCP